MREFCPLEAIFTSLRFIPVARHRTQIAKLARDGSGFLLSFAPRTASDVVLF